MLLSFNQTRANNSEFAAIVIFKFIYYMYAIAIELRLHVLPVEEPWRVAIAHGNDSFLINFRPVADLRTKSSCCGFGAKRTRGLPQIRYPHMMYLSRSKIDK